MDITPHTHTPDSLIEARLATTKVQGVVVNVQSTITQETPNMSQTITADQINAAAKTRDRVINRETILAEPTLLPIAAVERHTNKSGEGHRYVVTAQGFPPVTVWDRDAAAMNAAVGMAPKNASGFPVVPVLLTAAIDGDFYNVTAKPVNARVEVTFA